MPSETDATAGGDAGARRHRVLAAHAELFNEALSDEADRLPKLANVVEALALAADAEPLAPLTPVGNHVEGAVRLERVRRRIALWWESDDPAALAQAALERQVDILVVVQGFPLELAVDSEWANQLVLLDGRDLTLPVGGTLDARAGRAFQARRAGRPRTLHFPAHGAAGRSPGPARSQL